MKIDWYNNVASRFLKKLGELRKVVPTHALTILDFLDLFREIQKGCFSWTLCNNYSTLIKDFVKSVKYLQTYCPSTLKISFSISWKLHMVCCHLEPLLDRLNCGLAMVCEQAGEVRRYLIRDLHSSNFYTLPSCYPGHAISKTVS